GCVPDPVGPVTCGSSVQTRRRLGYKSGSFDPSNYGVEDPRSSAGVVGSWVTSFRSSIIRRTTPMSGYDSLPRSGLLEQPKYPINDSELLGDFPTLITTASQQGQLPVADKHARPKAGDSTSALRAQAVLQIDTIYAVQSCSGRIPLKWVTAHAGDITGYGEAVLGGAGLNAG